VKRCLIPLFLAACAFAGCGGTGGGGGSSTPPPPPVSIAGNWHFVATQSSTVNNNLQLAFEVNFNSQNQIAGIFAFTYQPTGMYYQAGVPCGSWPQQAASSALSGSTASLTAGDYQLSGTVSGSSISGTFTTTCSGMLGGTFTATSVGNIPQTTFSGTTDDNSFGPFALSLSGCLYQTIHGGILASSSSSASFSGDYSCGNSGQLQTFGMVGPQAGYSFLLSGTLGTTVAFYPPGQLPGTQLLYLFDPQTGSSGGGLALQ
jgi:hypothetical protein